MKKKEKKRWKETGRKSSELREQDRLIADLQKLKATANAEGKMIIAEKERAHSLAQEERAVGA